ncbi:hypothetical protein CY35_03G113300 [Sphagnum magellanicum]|nr:hypothetical protein CY35_03G113300 [Sphagnum magellanicum]
MSLETLLLACLKGLETSVVAVVYLQCKKNRSKGKQMLIELLLRGRNSRKRFRFSILRFVVHTF